MIDLIKSKQTQVRGIHLATFRSD